jgi:hypothetical protein
MKKKLRKKKKIELNSLHSRQVVVRRNNSQNFDQVTCSAKYICRFPRATVSVDNIIQGWSLGCVYDAEH